MTFFVNFPILKANLAIYIVIYHNESLKIENPSIGIEMNGYAISKTEEIDI